MWVGLDRFGSILADTTLATAILLSLVMLLMLLCQQPTRRVVLAQAAIVLAFFMFPLTATNPLPRLSSQFQLNGQGAEASHIRFTTSKSGASSGPSQSDPAQPGQSTSRWPGKSRWWNGLWPRRGLTLVYLAGVSIAMLWTLLGFWGIHRLVTNSVDPSQATCDLYVELTRQVVEQPTFPVIRVSSRITRPVLLGLFRPFILIPPVYDEPSFDKDSLRIILLHELAHAAQGDTYFNAAASLRRAFGSACRFCGGSVPNCGLTRSFWLTRKSSR